MTIRRRLFRLLLALVIGSFVIVTALAAYVYQYGRTDQAAKADVIVVLGGGVLANGNASPSTTRRVKHAVALYERGLAPLILCTGGYTERGPTSEAQACANLAEQEGVPATAILLEEHSSSTEENAIETQKVMAANHLNTALIVSDDFHLLRARLIFRARGINVITSPSYLTAGTYEWGWEVYNSYREVGALVWYMVKSALGIPITSTQL